MFRPFDLKRAISQSSLSDEEPTIYAKVIKAGLQGRELDHLDEEHALNDRIKELEKENKSIPELKVSL